eukprot:Colp12_sorted_trinity150504_noHs@1437
MNIFRLTGDISHLVAICILLYKIWTTRSCAGLSLRTQILFTITYATRYLDLFYSFVSIYNSVMKVFFLTASGATVYLMAAKFKATYNRNQDYFRLEYLALPAALLALLTTSEYSISEILWTFSIWLESGAILPQLFMIQRTGEAESITSHYLFALGAYRGLYILNWIYRVSNGEHIELVAVVAGVIQTILYCDFFYLYITKVLRGQKLLPA